MSNYHKYKKYKHKYITLKKEGDLYTYVPNTDNTTLCTDSDCDEFNEYNDYNKTDPTHLKQLKRITTSESENEVFFKIIKLSEIDENELSTSLKPNKFNILHIKNLPKFDKFTNKYGYLDDDRIRINWKDIGNDFKGLYLSPDTELRMERFDKALLNGKTHESWWEDEWKTDDVIIFVN